MHFGLLALIFTFCIKFTFSTKSNNLNSKTSCFLVKNFRKSSRLHIGGEKFKIEGTVVQSLGGTNFKVQIPGTEDVLCHIGGTLKYNRVRIDIGNKVLVEIHPKFPTRGRIVERLTNQFYKNSKFGEPGQLRKKRIIKDSSKPVDEFLEDEEIELEDFDEFEN